MHFIAVLDPQRDAFFDEQIFESEVRKVQCLGPRALLEIDPFILLLVGQVTVQQFSL